MHITGIVVSVDYADYLARSIDLWKAGLDRYMVVTSPRDSATKELCSHHGVDFHETEVFYSNGCVFNKAAAVCEAIETLPWEGWFLFLDADVIPPAEWRSVVESAKPELGWLYGSRRCDDRGRLIPDYEMPSYFQLWHTSDIRVQRRPILDIQWRHAGGYDSEFQYRWEGRKRWLPMLLAHLGEPGRNWWGRGNDEMYQNMRRVRNQTRTIADFERLDGKTQGWKG